MRRLSGDQCHRSGGRARRRVPTRSALTDALRLVVEQGEHVTSDQFKAGLAEMRAAQRTEIAEVRTQIAEVRTEIANLDTRLSTQISTTETRLTWRMLGIAGLVIAALRLLG